MPWSYGLYRFASRQAYEDLGAVPGAWLTAIGAAAHPDDSDPEAPPQPLPGWHAMVGWPEGEPAAWTPYSIPWEPGLPMPAGEDLSIPDQAAPVPAEITRAQARVAMAAHILADGRSLLSAVRELLAQMLEATAGLPDGDPQRIAAVQASEWWTAAAVYRRDHPVLQQMATVLGIASAEVDALFRLGAGIAP